MSEPTRDGSGGQADIDRVFQILTSRTRRDVLRHLHHHPESVSVEELARALDDDVSVTERRLGLYHRHLPMLEAAGLVSWDRDSELVSNASTPTAVPERTEFRIGDVSVTVAARGHAGREVHNDGETEC